jgi:hypothetical protein
VKQGDALLFGLVVFAALALIGGILTIGYLGSIAAK